MSVPARLERFRASLAEDAPPNGAGGLLEALWREAKGDWDAAHRVTQGIDGAESAWVHAYLHRREGDLSNAGYWYRRAGRPESRASLDEEWEEIVTALLATGGATGGT